MDVSDPRTELHFSQPVRQIVLMLLVFRSGGVWWYSCGTKGSAGV